MTLQRAGLVFLGGGLGASARAALIALLTPWNAPFPLIVLLINLLGCCLLGAVYAFADEFGLLRAGARLFIAVGVLGGFTTFSTFGWGVDQIAGRDPLLAAIYLGASVVGGILAAFAGLVLGREIVALLEAAARGVLSRLSEDRGRTGTPERNIRSVELEDEEETA